MKKNTKLEAMENEKNVAMENENLAADLESIEAGQGVESAEVEKPKYNDPEWLAKTDPTPYFSEEVSTKKYDPEREPKVARGLKRIAELGAKFPEIHINPLMLLLAKWWEVKPARAAIKKMIDEEAEQEGYTSEDFIQNHIGSQVDMFDDLGQAIERLRYARNYYKPRRPINTEVRVKILSITDKNGNKAIYDVPVPAYNKALEMANKDEARAYLISVSKVHQDVAEDF